MTSAMGSEYSAERRIEGIRPLSAVTKNEATSATDVTLERQWEKALEQAADELRAATGTRRSFKDLIKK